MGNAELSDIFARYLHTMQRLGLTHLKLSHSKLNALKKQAHHKLPSKSSSSIKENLPTSPKAGKNPIPQKEEELLAEAAAVSTFTDLTGDKAADMAALEARAKVCIKCPHLARTRKNVVFGVGNINAQLMFVGEAPGADEDIQGEPFVGRAGQLLTKMIEAMGLKRSDVYIANVLKCRPDMPPGAPGNRKPTPKEMETCLPYLRCQIQIIQPRVMVALGATAVEGLLGVQRLAISGIRGHWYEFAGIPLMPTFHPSYLLRDQGIDKKRLVWEDLLAVMEKLNMPISEKQRRFFTRSS